MDLKTLAGYYLVAVESGSLIAEDLAEESLAREDLSPKEKIDLHTYQFFTHWGHKRLDKIPFIAPQFPWL